MSLRKAGRRGTDRTVYKGGVTPTTQHYLGKYRDEFLQDQNNKRRELKQGVYNETNTVSMDTNASNDSTVLCFAV